MGARQVISWGATCIVTTLSPFIIQSTGAYLRDVKAA